MMLIFFGFFIYTVILQSISCLDGPYVYDNYTRSIIVKEGDSASLECYGSNNLPITWFRRLHNTSENLTLPNGESSCKCGNILELSSITYDQRGEYVCSVENPSGKASKFILVHVAFAPFIIETYQIHRSQAQELELRCIAEAYPIPKAIWIKNNITLTTNELYKIIDDLQFNDGFNTALIIPEKSDYLGTYECQIINDIGYSKTTFEVTALN